MYKEVSKLLLYSNLGGDSILENLARIFEDWEKGAAGKDAAADAVSVADGQSAVLEHSLQLAVVCSEEHECLAFLFHQIHNGGVVVALVLAAEDEHGGA